VSKFTLGPLTIGAPDRGYWRVNGKVPLDLALKLDAHPLRNRIRVAGHCCAPHPEAPWVAWFNPETGQELASMDDWRESDKWAKSESALMRRTAESVLSQYEFVEDVTKGVGFVMSYHIDGTEAMSVFMQMCAEYGLFGSKV